MREAKELWFDQVYGDERHYLLTLATHPDYQRKGIASMMIRWGINQARESGVPIILFASPMATPLYETLGFREVGRRHVQVPGEDERLQVKGMVCVPGDGTK